MLAAMTASPLAGLFYLWPLCVIGHVFLSCGFFFLFLFLA